MYGIVRTCHRLYPWIFHLVRHPQHVSQQSRLVRQYPSYVERRKQTGIGRDTATNPDAGWESQSLPIGNGSLGANIMGSVEAERITFNEKTLWRGGPNTSAGAAAYWNVNKPSAHILDEIRQAFIDGDEKRATLLTQKNFNSEVPYESWKEKPFRFGNFTTMGEFYIETGLSTIGMSDYKRILSLSLIHI